MPNQPAAATTSTHWYPIERVDAARVGAERLAWLSERGSLTQRLRERCDPEVEVRLLEQHEDTLPAAIAERLGLAAGSPCLLREVILRAAGKPRIFARTLIPNSTLSAHPWLGQLGEQPLGDALFAANDMRREDIEVAELGADDPLFQRATSLDGVAAEMLWCRRSVYRIAEAPLLVCECLLPGIESCRTV